MVIKGKPCLTNLKASCDEISDLVDKGRSVGIVYLDYKKVFDTSFHKTLIKKLMRYKLDQQRVRWTENCLNCQV